MDHLVSVGGKENVAKLATSVPMVSLALQELSEPPALLEQQDPLDQLE